MPQIPGYGGGMFPAQSPFGLPDYMSGINQAFAQNAALGQQQAAQPKKGSKFGEFLKAWAGSLGDSLTGNPVYAQHIKGQQDSERAARDEQAQKDWWYEQQRYKAENEKPNRQTITVDGIVLDQETMQPIWESPYPRIVPGPDGSFYEIPRQGLGGKGFETPSPAAPVGGNDVREQAIDAIRRGANPAEVLKRLQQLEGGAGQSSGPAPFPGY